MPEIGLVELARNWLFTWRAKWLKWQAEVGQLAKGTIVILELDRQSHAPLYTQIAAQVRQLIRHGTLKIGDRLPANRELAKRLGVSRSTVVTAYDELLGDGLIAARIGSGTFVAGVPAAQVRAQTEAVAAASPADRAAQLGSGAALNCGWMIG